MRNFKRRFVSFVVALIMVVGVMPVSNAFAFANEYFEYAYWAYSYGNYNVYQTEDMANGTIVGGIGTDEGVTVLEIHNNSTYGLLCLIEFGTPWGAQRGYVYYDQLWHDNNNTSAGRITSSTSTYYWETYNSPVVGSVSTNEIVAVLGNSGNGWVYIEYNVNNNYGRKRGYIPASNISVFGSPLYIYWKWDGVSPVIYDDGSGDTAPYYMPVYPMPRNDVSSIGYVNEDEPIAVISSNIYINATHYWYILYKVSGTGQFKSGYVKP